MKHIQIAVVLVTVTLAGGCGLSNNAKPRQRTSDDGKIAPSSQDATVAEVSFSSADLPTLGQARISHSSQPGTSHAYRFEFKDEAGKVAIIFDVSSAEPLVAGTTYAYRASPQEGEAELAVGTYKIVKTDVSSATDIVGDISVTPISSSVFQVEASGISRDSESFSLTANNVSVLEIP